MTSNEETIKRASLLTHTTHYYYGEYIVKPHNIKRATIIYFILSVLLTGCATSPPFMPTYFDRSIYSEKMEDIKLLPLVDFRKDKSLLLSEKWPSDAFTAFKTIMGMKIYFMPKINYFKDDKGYEVTLFNDYGGVGSISEYALENADPLWIRSLGPNDSNWILILTLEDLGNRETFGVAAAAECSGYLFDKTLGKLVWKQKITEEFSAGGLIGYMASEHGPSDAVLMCFSKVYQQFPKKPQQ